MLPLILALTIFNSLAILYLVAVQQKMDRAAPKETNRLPSSTQAALPAVSPSQSLTASVDENVLSAEECGKIDVQASRDSILKDWYTLTIYNGTEWQLEELTINLVALLEGQEVLARHYIVEATRAATPLTTFNVKNFRGFVLEDGQATKATVIGGRKNLSAK